MVQLNRMNMKAFTLIELVIVVVIIGTIAAIAIPRLSRGAEGAADAKLKGDLAVLRNAIDLYATEHGGLLPSGTEATFIAQLTTYTDSTGATSATKTGNYIYGPYLRSIPKLSVGLNKDKDGIETTTLGANSKGWFYDPATGEIKANLANAAANQDASGVEYNTY